jgi:hypothetical protein
LDHRRARELAWAYFGPQESPIPICLPARDPAPVGEGELPRPSTLRFYDEKGLIASTGRRGLRRLFDPGVLERLALIALGRAAGFSLGAPLSAHVAREWRLRGAQPRAGRAQREPMPSGHLELKDFDLEPQAREGWGAKVIEQPAHDLRTAFPDMKGFSRANLMYMPAFAEAWPNEEAVQQLVGHLPLGHNLVLRQGVHWSRVGPMLVLAGHA